MRVVLMGGGGLLGSFLAPALVANGHEVLIFDNLSGCDRNRLPKGIRLFVGNATVRGNVEACFESFKPEIVFICLSHPLKKGVVYKYLEDTNNTINSVNAIGSLLNDRVKAVYFCSTGDVYGKPEPKQSISEDRKIVSSNSHFGNACLLAENNLSFRCEELGIPLTILRIFDLFGPRYEISPRNGIVNYLVEAFLGNEQVAITRADRRRDFVFVQDVVMACLDLIALGSNAAGVYNVGSGVGISLDKLCRELHKIVPITNKPWYMPDASIHTYSAVADISKIQEKISWRPKEDIISYLPTLVEYTKQEIIKSNNPAYKLALARGFINE